jgi:hypothetical protein
MTMLKKRPASSPMLIRASLRHFLESGDVSEAVRENPWFALGLTSAPAAEAVRCWAAGDKAGAIACLRHAVPSHMLQ